MKRNVWILNHYAASMYYSSGGRHYWFAKYLKREGYEPVIFCANTKHGVPERYVDTPDLWTTMNSEDIDVPFVLVKSIPYSSNGMDRILNMIGFYRNVQRAARQYAKIHGKPDVIYASSVHPLTLVGGLKLAKYFGVKCICEMRDLWPEAIVAYSSRISKDSLLAKAMYAGERWIYERADALIFTQEGGLDYIREKGWDIEHGGRIDMQKAHHINNGVDLDAFDQNVLDHPYPDKDMDDSDTLKVVYTGAIRRINNLGILVDAAKCFTDSRIRLIVFGDGDELEGLRKRVEDEHISNVRFKGSVNKVFIPSIVCRSDVNVVHWEMNPLVRVGESYNKAFEYYAAGKPVFYTIRPGYSIVERYKAGLLTEGFTPADIARGIEALLSLPEKEREIISRNARHVAEVYDFGHLTANLIGIIEGL